MKRLVIGLFALGLAACQSHPAQVARQPAARPVRYVEVADTTRSAIVQVAVDTAAPPTLHLSRQPLAAAAMARLLERHDLSNFWRGQDSQEEMPPLDGFFGPDYRRISFAFISLRRDSRNPALYHVTGKTRLRQTVTPFTGEVRITSVIRLRPDKHQPDVLWHELDVDSLGKVYSATATFAFREDSAAAGAGQYVGTSYLDFCLTLGQPAQLARPYGTVAAMPTKGTGILYRGHWTNYYTNQVKALLLSSEVAKIAPVALIDFTIGDRDATFNPKYAKLGWNEYWANDEWWADSPKPKLSL